MEVKNAILAGMPEEVLVRLAFDLKDAYRNLKWKDDHEFEYRGEMYDVVDKISAGDSVIFYCYQDHRETTLNKLIASFLSKAFTSDVPVKNHLNRLIQFFQSFVDGPAHETLTVIQGNFFKYPPMHLSNPMEVYQVPPTPPPWPLAG